MTSRVAIHREPDHVTTLHMQDLAGENSFNQAFVQELVEALNELAHDKETKVCVIQGLPDIFCSGAHKDMLHELASGTIAASDIVLPKMILELPFPIIAAMEGHAVGGGLSLGLSCDLIFMARESRYGCNFMNMGFTPGMGTTKLLRLAIGEYKANEMMYGGQFFKGSYFEHASGINGVFPKREVLSKAMSIALRISEKPRFALETLKRALSLPRRQGFEASLTVESMMHGLTFSRPETRQRIEEEYASSNKKVT